MENVAIGGSPPFRSERRHGTTSGGILQIPNGFPEKLLFHLTFKRNFFIPY